MTSDRMEIIHVVPKLFPYGAYGMLSELHFAINMYWSKDVSQSIINLSEKSVGKDFHLPYITKDEAGLAEYLKLPGRKIVFLHKLWATDCSSISKMTAGLCPFVIINHTACDNCFGIAQCDTLVTVSQDMYKTFKTKFPKLPSHFIRNGVNKCRYDGIKPYDPGQVKGFFVTGRLNNFNNVKHPNKWSEFCLHGVNLGIPMWHDYIGGGKHRDAAIAEARKRLKNKGGNIIHFPGHVGNFETKVGYIKRWNAFLYEIPGVEGTSMSLLESFACGVPAIINNKPGNNEIVKNGVNGFVCNSRNEMVSRLKELARGDKAAKKLAVTTRDFFDKNLDAKVMAQKYVALAKSLIERYQ